MRITVEQKLVEATGGKATWGKFGLEPERWSGSGRGSQMLHDVDLALLEVNVVRALDKHLEKHERVRGVKIVRADIARWVRAVEDGAEKQKPRSLRQFADLLADYLLPFDGHRIYERDDDQVWLPYYVSEIRFHPEENYGDRRRPAQVSMERVHYEFDKVEVDSVIFYADDVRGATVAESLARKNLFAETFEYRRKYLRDVARFHSIAPRIGAQFLATGTATDNVDEEAHWSWARTKLEMVREGQPTRVVVDVFREGSERDSHHHPHYKTYYWQGRERRKRLKLTHEQVENEASEAQHEGRVEDEEDESSRPPEVPLHPMLAVFDLSKHVRLRIHVGFLREYKYDTALADKLVLPETMKQIVRMLIEHRGRVFQDIVKGKGGGAVVLLAGPPGVGKTLTAEVFAESEQRALYSVQCSQLGTDPEKLEGELLTVFARARRWGAVMLLDEADVYVHERGNDMQQNAIVGVFLRVLEYQASVLFLTTNRPDDVDDAIASRCVARLTYPFPTREEQARIWRTLADVAKIPLSDFEIASIVPKPGYPADSGRDIKNLLKLASLVSEDGRVTAEAVEFARSFKPTRSHADGDQ